MKKQRLLLFVCCATFFTTQTQAVCYTIGSAAESNPVQVLVSSTQLQLNETGETTETFTVSLNATPSANVAIQLTFSSSQLRVDVGSGFGGSPQTVTLTPANALVGVMVTVQAVDDPIDEADPHQETITTSNTTSTLSDFNNIPVDDVTVSISDNDVAGVTISETGGSTDVAEGGATDTYTVVLNSQPTANVTIALGVGSQLMTSPSQLVFTAANWNISQTVTVMAVDDALVEGNHTGSIQHTAISADANYNGISLSNIFVNITDNDAGCPLAGIVYVNANSPSGGNGLSWNTAFDKLQDALNLACNCTGDKPEIWVAQGTYYPDEGIGQTDNDRNSSFSVCDGVALYGGFSGGGTETLLSQRDVTANETILSGDLMGDDGPDFANNVENAYRVVFFGHVANHTILDGFTIIGGNGEDTRNGGGIYNDGSGLNRQSNPRIINCIVTGNVARSGAGLFNDGLSGNASPILTNCVFSGNLARRDGGGAYNFGGNNGNSSPVFINCVFSGNKAERIGGGVFNDAVDVIGGVSNPNFINCSFSGNQADFGVGGMYNDAFNGTCSPTIVNSILWGNAHQIDNRGASPIVQNSIVQGGYADGTGILDADPLFVEGVSPADAPTANGDFRLQACSPAINAGNNMANTTATDLDGNSRIEAGIIDMGAYEFQGIAVCVSLSGSILWEHERIANPVGVPDVEVALMGDDTGSAHTGVSGDYAITTTGGNLTLTPTKTTGDAYEGVDVADVTRIQQHVTFINRFDDGYKVIAADVNQSNSVTGLDAALIFHAINGNPSAQVIFETPAWRFVDSTHTFVDENAPWPFPEDISLTNVMADVINQSFVGAKMGDVNGTWATPVPLTSPTLSLMVQDVALKAGQTLRIPFRANGLPDVAAWQFALRFDTDYLRFERALPTAAFPLKDENFGAWQADRGELRSVFALPQGLVLPKEEVIFELEFQVVRGGLRLSEVLNLDNGILDGRVYNTALSGGAVALTFEAVETRRIASLLPGEAPLGFALEQNMPNPFSNETLIRFQLPEAGEAAFSVHDVQGRLLYEQRGFLGAGLHEVRLDAERLGATGVLSYTLRCGAHSATRRMVVVR